jgi:nitrate reductase NapE component
VFEDIDRQRLQRRLRALLIVGSFLAPAFCVFSMLAVMLIANGAGWVLWLLLTLWLITGVLLAAVVSRMLKTLSTLNNAQR